MLGTAPPAARMLLIEQPGPWGPRALLDGRDDARVAEQIGVLAGAAGLRVQAIRYPGQRTNTPGRRSVAVADIAARRILRWSVADLPELLHQLTASTGSNRDAALDGLLAQPVEITRDHDPLYLVCTHGRHDACCALRGRPLVQALHAIRPGRVWETTHVGGDRFAANLVVLPYGDMYGRVLPFAADDLVGQVDRGEVIAGLMRGRVGLSPIAQAALVFAHQQLGVHRRDALRVVRVDRVSDDLARVALEAPDGPVQVEIAMSTSSPAQLTCQGPAQSRARVYRGVRITAPAG
ncbi:MAG: sucrase ferredoxin [Dermatophilaceae bacterium]